MTRPINELFYNPVTQELLADIQVTRQQVQKLGSIEACFQLATEATNRVGPSGGALVVSHSTLEQLQLEVVKAANYRLRSRLT